MHETAKADHRKVRWTLWARLTSWDHFPLVLVLALSLTAGGIVIARADSLAFDSVIFVRFARQLSQASVWAPEAVEPDDPRHWFVRNSPLLDVLDRHAQHPGFAFWILGVYRVIDPYFTWDESTEWALSAHLASLVGFGILIWGVYRLASDQFGPTAGWVSAGIIGLSPPLVRIGADALSDAPAAAFLIWSGVYFCRVLRTGRSRDAVLGSVLAGAGYLIRPETIQLALGVSVLLGLRFVTRSVGRRRDAAWLLACSLIPAVFFVAPYVAVKGSALTKKAYLVHLKEILRDQKVADKVEQRAAEVRVAQADTKSDSVQAAAVVTNDSAGANSRGGAAKVSWSSFLPRIDLSLDNYRHGLSNFGLLWTRLLAFEFLPLVWLGIIASRKSIIRRPDQQLLAGAALANTLALPFLLHCLCGYLDIRHVLPACALTVVWAWPGFVALGLFLREIVSRMYFRWNNRPLLWWISAEFVCKVVIVISIVSMSALSASQKLNTQAIGLRAMGEWMRENLPTDARVVDPCHVTAFYARLDASNRWPYIGNLAVGTLQEVLDYFGDAQYLVLSDQQVRDLLHFEQLPGQWGEWRMVEIHSTPLSAVTPPCPDQVRTYQVTRAKDPAASLDSSRQLR